MAESESGEGANRIGLGEIERWVLTIGGGALVLYGLKRRSFLGLGVAAMGATLIYRGVSERRPLHSKMGTNAASQSRGEKGRVRVEKGITVNKSPEALFAYWRKLENLPSFIGYLQEVREKNGNESQWVGKKEGSTGPILEWEVKIVGEKQNELIAWRAVENGEIHNIGSVRFEKTPNGAATYVRLSMEFNPTESILGAALARLFGSEPGRRVEEDLKRFKALMEGENLSAAA